MGWIFKSFKQDFLRLYFPGIIAWIIYSLISGLKWDTWQFAVFNFIVFSLTDVGHTYTTLLKTAFDKGERRFSHMVWLAPVIVMVVMLVWRFNFDFRWWWVFVAYYTLFHNQRQGFGVMKWYESLNKRHYNITKFFYYSFTLLPFIIFHFRDLDFSVFYYISQKPIFHMEPNNIHLMIGSWDVVFYTPYHAALVGLWFLILNIWILWEVNNYLVLQKVEWNRILAIMYFGAIYSYSFLLSKSSSEILTLLIASHGVPYMFMLNKRMIALPSWDNWKRKIPYYIPLLAAIGGVLDYFYNVVIYEWYPDYQVLLNPNSWQLILIMLYVVPIMSHFIWDSYLWKKGHPDGSYFYRN